MPLCWQYCQSVEYDSGEKLSANNYSFAQQPIDTAFDIEANRKILNEFENADPQRLSEAMSKAEQYSKKGSFYGALLGIKKYSNVFSAN